MPKALNIPPESKITDEQREAAEAEINTGSVELNDMEKRRGISPRPLDISENYQTLAVKMFFGSDR
ncbi:hypothetical protein [Nodularia sp. UHCC 0506]|uniref:hypothetical protein n=1 Tax=Nodularia sp. UHCC 0506 TaxID=3110243 RepID=UPI002B1F690E|nr:hypothetical protein [Nodularia sp. UHCC 0506]MEA5515675.1 hypothetical protein [Nodularia sp. UHCC 0506]